ncbi:hypothetical protein [Saccharopolyspora antimicrobica]|uniref:hypothetical protein n=1 Tax=Saccharopolyspora antimicrobica TaxID=455193 RepID=UPI001FEB2320|nr:hypothetical protein [Saccharopolyspora antimicrobica]
MASNSPAWSTAGDRNRAMYRASSARSPGLAQSWRFGGGAPGCPVCTQIAQSVSLVPGLRPAAIG